MKSKKFKKKIDRLRKIMIQEMIDGCLDCQEQNSLCFKHYKEAADIILNPRKGKFAEEVKRLKKDAPQS